MRLLSHRSPRGLVAVLLAAGGAVLALAAPAAAQLGVTEFDGIARSLTGPVETQAGAHPDVSVTITTPTRTVPPGWHMPQENMRTLRVSMPPGLIGEPLATPRCTLQEFSAPVNVCPVESQVGVVEVGLYLPGYYDKVALYNLEPSPGRPALFGFNVASTLNYIEPAITPSGDHLVVTSENISQTAPVFGVRVTLWGVPADPIHDALRVIKGTPQMGVSSTAPRRPFMTLPTSCTGPVETSLLARSWQDPDAWTPASFLSHDDASPTPSPAGTTGCERLVFEPTASVQATGAAAGGPTGLSVRLRFPQDRNPDGLAPSQFRTASVTLPEGMAISPASADGLQACSDEQFAADAATPARCPAASAVATVHTRTPLLEEPLDGSVSVGTQRSDDPASGEMFRLFMDLVDEQRGVHVKLVGRIHVDPGTGRLTTTFADNPKVPVSEIELRFKAGPRAPLTLPQTCGPHTVALDLTGWSGAVRHLTDTIDVACPAPRGFAPTLRAGVANATAGTSSPFSLTVARADGDQELRAIERVELPAGLLAKVASVPLCPEADAAAGTCPEASRIGTVQVANGAGAAPLWVPQAGHAPTSVSLGGRYRGAPFSLSIVVPAQAGPFDLGTVVVRAALHVDPKDAHVTAETDPLPQIVRGVPLRIREIRLLLDRPGFMLSPTSCAAMRVGATLSSTQGARATLASRVQVGGCAALPLSPTISVQGGGKGQTVRYRHPALRVRVSQPAGQARLSKANVVLPRAFNVDLKAPALRAACSREAYAQDRCSPVATVGSVKAVTPVFREPLTGKAFLLQKKGQLPDIVMRLENVHYRIDLIGVLDFLKDGRVITRVSNVPDAPLSSFELTIEGGKGGSLLTRSDLCAKRAATQATFKGQNGALSVKTPTTRISGCAASSKRAVGGRS